MEELKALLPEIQEKVEDATEALKSGSTAAETVKGVLVSWGWGSFLPTTHMVCEITIPT